MPFYILHPVTHLHPISSQFHPNPPSFHPPKPSLHTGPKGHTNRHRAWHIPASGCHGRWLRGCSSPAVPAPGSAPEPTLARAGGQIWPDIAKLYRQGDKVSLGTLFSAMVSYDRHAECRLGGWGYLSDFEKRCEDLVEAPGFRCSSSCSQKCRIGWH